jgi:hypothetical protein
MGYLGLGEEARKRGTILRSNFLTGSPLNGALPMLLLRKTQAPMAQHAKKTAGRKNWMRPIITRAGFS